MVAALTFSSIATAAPISKAIQFRALNLRVTCGEEIHAPNKPATEVLCAAKGIPAPTAPGSATPGSSRSACSARLRSRLSQDSFIAGKSANLGRGRIWNQLGVTCHVGASTVLCFNGDNHGFVIGDGHYRTF